MTIFYYVFKRFFRKISNAIFLCILPLAAVLLPMGDWFPLPMGFQYYGAILIIMASKLTSIIMEDRTNRILLRIGAAPITHFQYLWQNLLAFSLILTVLNLGVVIAGVVVHGDALVAPSLLFIIYSLFSMTSIGFCLAWYSLFRSKEFAFNILGGVILLMVMLGGMMWPIEAMPIIFQRIAMLLPTYWLMEGMKLIASGSTLFELVLPFVILFMFSIAFLLLGSRRRIF